MKFIRKIYKFLAVFVIANLLSEIIFPVAVYALTGGPSQPEVQSFEPVGTSEMVDMATGDFNYNIPLMDVEGYPINIAYHGGVSMDQEASWVGLGWNINPGAINRAMRGIPDDFDGDGITREMHLKENWTAGATFSASNEFFGYPINNDGKAKDSNFFKSGISLSLGLGIYYNNYRGWGMDFSPEIGFKIGLKNNWSLNGGLNMNFSSQNGLELGPHVGLGQHVKGSNDDETSIEVGSSYNSRQGFKQLTLSENAILKIPTSISMPLATPTYVPQISFPMANIGLSLNGSTGVHVFGLHPNLNLKGYYTSQNLTQTKVTAPAYGYMYSEDAADIYSIQDFNREKDGSYNQYKKRLPVTNFTYDIYSVCGQGIGTTLRPHRSDVGIVFDNHQENNSIDLSGGFKLGTLPSLIKLGVNAGLILSNSSSGRWTSSDDGATSVYKHQTIHSTKDAHFESYYFKSVGETAQRDTGIYYNLAGDKPVAVSLFGVPLTVSASDRIDINGDYSRQLHAGDLYAKTRSLRNNNVAVLNAAEADTFAYQKIYTYPKAYWNHYSENGAGSSKYRSKQISRIKGRSDVNAKHISELTVTQPNGSKYVYGIPAYNTLQKEATFNIGLNTSNTGFTTYSSGDNSIGNTKGYDEYFSATTLPGYAHSYLLTAVVSSDYQDLTGDGITDDDYGTWTKMNYSRVYPKSGYDSTLSNQYHWRVPFKSMSAHYNEGLKSRNDDQKASYLYGTKEIWMVNSIESKNYVAQFYLSNRHDGYGVLGENGGLDSNAKVQKLDSICLFLKQDIINHGIYAVPLKTVVFEYNYELCSGVDNNDGKTEIFNGSNINSNKGKLTLKKIYFKYSNSAKGRFTPYQFYYADPSHTQTINSANNPSYNPSGYDRWGMYKKQTGSLANFEFPYTDQDSASYKANVYAAAWSLNTIVLPSGGLIKIDYESDDYAYVQDKRAMQMFKIMDVCTKGRSFIPKNGQLFGTNGEDYLYLKIKLPYAVASKDSLKSRYLDGINDLYFKMQVYLNPSKTNFNGFLYPSSVPNKIETINGYCQIDQDSSSVDSSDHTIGYIKIKPSSLLDDGSGEVVANPIAKAAWQFTKINNPDIIFPGSDPIDDGLTAIDGLVSSFTRDIPIIFSGFNTTMYHDGFSRTIIPDKSFIRLCNPTFKKYGGGARVKKLVMNDNWAIMATGGASSSEYGQTYDYRKFTKEHGWISSGVASYEPSIGNDENPFHAPIPYTVSSPGTSNKELYDEQPFGESFFPAPTVVYNTVKVTNIKPAGKESEINRTGTGYSVYEFYTSQDFPTQCSNTNINPHAYNPISIANFFQYASTTKTTVSQGYSIVTNDMHGKPKAVWQYAEHKPEFDNSFSRASMALTGVEYVYKTKNNNNHELDNYVTVINNSGQKEANKMQIGVEVDPIVDMREASTTTSSYKLSYNGDMVQFGVGIIILAVMIIPGVADQTNQFRSAVFTKVVSKSGILEKVIYHDNGQSTATVNEAWDKETGTVLLQKTYNEFNDPIYNFTYPAHWKYDAMDLASLNQGVVLSNVSFDNKGAIQYTDPLSRPLTAYITPGDMVSLSILPLDSTTTDSTTIDNQGVNNTTLLGPFWVYTPENHVTSNYFLIDRAGKIFKGEFSSSGTNMYLANSFELKVIRSGRKNMPNASIGSLVARNKIYNSSNAIVYDSILNASAVEYSDHWQTYCCGYTPLKNGGITSYKDSYCDTINPFVKGVRGDWRPMRNYAFIGQRTSSSNHEIRLEGNYKSFTPFWTYGSSVWTGASNSTSWQWATQVTKASPFGYEVETRDTLGRYNAVLYGYDYSLNTAVANNAKTNQVGYDGFEDYTYAKINKAGGNTFDGIRAYPPHFGFYSPFYNSLSFLAKDTSHTGRYSIRVEANQIQYFEQDLNVATSGMSTTDTIYRLKLSDCIGKFAPDGPAKYVAGAWVHVANTDSFNFNQTSLIINIKRTGHSDTTFTTHPSGVIIEGWQRIEGGFFMPSGATKIQVKFSADPNNKTYFDDLRIFPINANMKSFVYDPQTFRLVATLDENNYATFYEYDEEGSLVRVKKETARGIMTIQENRKHIRTN